MRAARLQFRFRAPALARRRTHHAKSKPAAGHVVDPVEALRRSVGQEPAPANAQSVRQQAARLQPVRRKY